MAKPGPAEVKCELSARACGLHSEDEKAPRCLRLWTGLKIQSSRLKSTDSTVFGSCEDSEAHSGGALSRESGGTGQRVVRKLDADWPLWSRASEGVRWRSH